ncbi:MAG: putative HTH-type transcriptional regulator YnfL [Blastococcus sp.]|nr:putative HTH-type transcriptional regulator YnfL [Blastococcus sp.]
MELRQLQYLVAVARVGSFLGAASALGVPQPSLWRSVRALEAELGVALFERSGRGVQVTGAGHQLLPRAEQLLDRAGAISLLAAELAHGRAGVVTVACAHPHVPRFLAPLIGSFWSTHPGVHIAVHESSGLPAIDQVLDGDVDLVTGLPQADPRLAGHQLGDVRLAVVTSDDHPWRGRNLIPTAELRGQPVLIGHASSLTRRLLEPALREGGFALDITMESGNAATLVALARAGLGVAVVADDNLAVDDSTSWPALVDEHSPMSSPLWIYWSRERALAPVVQSFVRHIQDAEGNAHHEGGKSRPG